MARFSLEDNKRITKGLCDAVREADTLEDMQQAIRSGGHELEIVQAWQHPNEESFRAMAAKLMVRHEEILVVAFRSTVGVDEWLQYPDTIIEGDPLVPHEGGLFRSPSHGPGV